VAQVRRVAAVVAHGAVHVGRRRRDLPFGGAYQPGTNVTVEQRHTYTGREKDPASALMYYRYRQYDPRVGRFGGRDPILYQGGIGIYVYADNNSTNATDAWGLLDDASQIQPGDPCYPCCDRCEATGDLAAADAGTTGHTIKLSVTRSPTLTSYSDHGEEIDGHCCAASYMWWNCYSRTWRYGGSTWTETVIPNPDLQAWQAIQFGVRLQLFSCVVAHRPVHVGTRRSGYGAAQRSMHNGRLRADRWSVN